MSFLTILLVACEDRAAGASADGSRLGAGVHAATFASPSRGQWACRRTSRKRVSCGLILWKTTFWMEDLPDRRAPMRSTLGLSAIAHRVAAGDLHWHEEDLVRARVLASLCSGF